MATNKRMIKHNIQSSDWISNFWFIDNNLILTDSIFNDSKKMLSKLSIENINNNLVSKKLRDDHFIVNPDPIKTSILESSISNVEIINYFDDFIFNVTKFDQEIYISFINGDNSYVMLFDNDFNYIKNIKEFDDYLIIGNLNENLVLKSVKTRETFFVNDDSLLIKNIKKIINLDDRDIALTDDNIIYFYNKDDNSFEEYKTFTNEVNITKFDNLSFIVSDKERKITYLDNMKHQEYILDDNYYYRIQCWNKEVIVGKPLYLGYNFESYSLPLTFIK